MRQNYIFHASVMPSSTFKIRPDLFDRSIEAFERKEYLTSLHLLLDSIDQDLRNKYGNREGNEFCIPHGPIHIHLKQKGEILSITAPFVNLPEENRIAMMRQVAALNFNDLDLARLNLKEDRLYFEYACPLVFCHPRKVQHILEEICRVGAKYDYEFLNRFDVQRIVKPLFTPYPDGAIDYIYKAVQQSCEECLEALKYFEPLRKFKDMRRVIDTTLLKIIYIACPQGKLLNFLQKAHRDMERDTPLALMVTNGKKSICELQEKTKKEWEKSLYRTETFISNKKRSNLQEIRESYENCHKQVLASIEAGDFREAGIRMVHKFYETYYSYPIPKRADDILAEALKQSSALPWKEATFILYEALEKIRKSSFETGQNRSPIAA